jgi:signal peptide peptidase SppA
MKLQHIIQAVYFQPWAITREGWGAVNAIVRNHLDGRHVPKAEEDAETDFFGNAMPKMEINDDGVAIIPIKGTLLQHASMMEKMCGACSYQDIQHDLDTASRAARLQKVVLDIDSPGGMCVGNQETASMVARMVRQGIRVEAVTDTQMCSAAYNIAAAATQITCTPSAIIGSIGAMMAVLDQSSAFEMVGLKQEVFASGPFKGAGVPGTALTDDQRMQLQSMVDKYAGMFKNHVRANRIVDEETMQGQVFIGSQAMDAGLVDSVMRDMRKRMMGDEGEDEDEMDDDMM